MRIYVVTGHDGDDFDEVKEVFVNEQDAKNYIADNSEGGSSYRYVATPRKLRTGWHGKR